jgi:cell division septation protein DedD
MMPERKGRSKEQSLWLVLVWVVTLAAMVGLGVLLGKYVLSYCASSLQAPRSSQAPTTGSGLLDSSDSQPSPISPKSTEEPDPRPSGQPAAVTLDTTDITPGTREVAEESVLYRVQVGEFYERSKAEELGRKLEEAGYPVYVTSVTPYRIQVGAFQNKANAEALASELEAEGYSVIIQR